MTRHRIGSAIAMVATALIAAGCGSDAASRPQAAAATGSPDNSPQTEASSQAVKVPDVTGMSLDDARSSLQSADLEVVKEMGAPADIQYWVGKVATQSPTAGSPAQPGDEVTLVVHDDLPEPTPLDPPESAPIIAPAQEIIDGPVVADASGDVDDWEAALKNANADLSTQVPGVLEGYNGVGDDIVDFEEPFGMALLNINHRGDSNFMVHALFEDGSDESLVNEIGQYVGQVLAIGESDLVGLEIRADGPWAVIAMTTIAQDSDKLARAYKGEGDSVITFPMWDSVEPVTDFDRATITHDGESNFKVRQWLPVGSDGLVNEIGPYSGTVRLNPDGMMFLEINADGAWTIEFQ